MAVYHQMGHNSQNLLGESGLDHYGGAILSPVDYSQSEVSSQVSMYQTDSFDLVFDSQLYYPKSHRRKLPRWSYFPSDVDTADQGSWSWWRAQVNELAKTARELGVYAVCSPSVVPRAFGDEYYALMRRVAMYLADLLAGSDVKVLQTLLVRLGQLSQEGMSERIASIASGSNIPRVYLILVSEGNPRRELREIRDIQGAMRLIRFLEQAGLRVLIGFCCSDVILWKTAGASDCATGKFWNLRRFTPSRWQESAGGGGGQVPYWFEERLMAFLRASDLSRLEQADLLSERVARNPYGREVLRIREESPGRPWLGVSWRQYMYWFGDFERRLEAGAVAAAEHLAAAEERWGQLDAQNILMEKRQNDGGWLRPWRRALVEAFRDPWP